LVGTEILQLGSGAMSTFCSPDWKAAHTAAVELDKEMESD
jgi:hypothetical protein